MDALRRNAGGEALNAYMHCRAATPDPVGLLGGIFFTLGGEISFDPAHYDTTAVVPRLVAQREKLVSPLSPTALLHDSFLRDFVQSSPQWLFYGALAGIVVLARLHNTRLWTVATVALAIVIAYSLFTSMRNDSLVGRWLSTRPMLVG